MTLICSYWIGLRNSIVKRCFEFIGRHSIYYLVAHQQLIIHPINSYDIKFTNRLLNCLVRFIPAFCGSTLFALTMAKIKSKTDQM